MRLEDFDYDLPPELIAQSPEEIRDASRLMALDRATGDIRHGVFRDLDGRLRAGDVLVVNDTRVYPARLKGRKAATGGKVEALLTRDLGGGRYLALVKGGPRPGTSIDFDGGLSAVVEPVGAGEDDGGRRILSFASGKSIDDRLDEVGSMPLPPYISAPGRDEVRDRERYQTVYAKKRGAVAAPTAGLHFTPELIRRLEEAGVRTVAVTLHVGPGTFMPVRADRVEDHVMEEEEYEVSGEAAEAVNGARRAGGRVVAVGTTSLRTLESAAGEDGLISPGGGKTGLFIYPGYRFRAVDALITNFHLPRSTLIMLVAAFAGREPVLKAYREAVAERYRFYSYGDAMFIS